jgi:hypothetical protein
MQKLVFPLILLVCLTSCDYFQKGQTEGAVARVNANYLFESDLAGLVSEGTPKEDSILIVYNYINRWATQQLLINQANKNLSQEKLNDFENLVNQYKDDLYTEAYKSVIVSGQLDSIISEKEYEEFYELNKENFKLNDVLVKVRFIHVDEDYTNLRLIKEKFRRFNNKDKQELTELSIQFKAKNFNDSIWIEKDALFKVMPVLQTKDAQVLKKSNYTQLQDSLGVYLVKIEDALNLRDIAPISYIKPSLEQIILNKRKLELIKKLEKDITKDAIKNNDFEIFTPQ